MVYTPDAVTPGILVYGGLDQGDTVVLTDMWVLAP